MRSGLGHRIVRYMVMNVLVKHSGSVFTGHQKMDVGCPDQNLGIHPPDYMIPYPGRL
jgi:hypothetical protein